MASYIKRGESILIPFRNGLSIADSQLKPRMYKTMQAFEKSFPGHYLGTSGVELAEYAEVVRCKDCESQSSNGCPDHRVWCRRLCRYMDSDGFCSDGERREGE
jgi:hypothetical protein